MSLDRREGILARMFAVLQTITPISPATVLTVIRNRGELGEDKRPTLVMLDGVEEHLALVENRGRLGLSPNKVRMRPQVFILIQPRPPKNEGVGEELNAYRMKILSALDQDTNLTLLLGTNGEFVYERANTDLQTGSAMQGQMQIFLSLVYSLNPSEF